MKVTGPGHIQSTASTRKKPGAGGSFSIDTGDSSSEAAPLKGAAPLTQLGAILALQEVEDATTGRRRAIARAEDMLDRLEEIRVGLLTGTIPEGKLRSLTRILRGQRDQTADPHLAEILAEIELRAEVELAKLESRD